jgi:hypothetical protein
MATNGQPPVAVVQIIMHFTPEGAPDIRATYQGPGRDVFNMMMARAQQDIVPVLTEKEKEMKKSVVAPTPQATLALGRT